MNTHELTISPSATSAISPFTAVRHSDLVFLEDVAAPHAFGIDSSVGTAAEGAAQTRLFALRPTLRASLAEVLLLGGAPAPRGLKLRRVGDSIWIGVKCRLEVIRVEEPLRIRSHQRVREALWVMVGVGEVDEWGVDEHGLWVLGARIERLHWHSSCTVLRWVVVDYLCRSLTSDVGSVGSGLE